MNISITTADGRAVCTMLVYEARLFQAAAQVFLRFEQTSGEMKKQNDIATFELPTSLARRLGYALLMVSDVQTSLDSDNEIRFVLREPETERTHPLTDDSSAKKLVFEIGKTTIADAEREMILRTLQHASQNKTEAARQLGIGVKTIYNKLRSYNIDPQTGGA
jgi:DNA-binding NtrC family response regulator